ncbi:Hyphally regulated cell wall protein [Quillaja saponaria]|uniref:Hyphally regulated cell wall protein n=1 Tax=Quillaja saponaria TaxID=32244 RepID=A0AAD7P900_QUISA|nr:Hyphally regulated cell wall protein [Quillaja saponaria]
MDASKTISAKQLKEYLQDQQEPFTLYNYLSERRYLVKNFNAGNGNVRPPICSSKKLKMSSEYDLQNTRDRKHATGTLTSALHNASENHCEVSFLCYKHHMSSILNMFQTFSFSKLRKLETATDTIHGIIMKDMKQNRRKSELKQSASIEACQYFRLSQDGEATSASILPKETIRDPIFSASLSELLVNSEIPKDRHVGYEKLQKMIGIFSLRRRNKRMQQKRKQLQSDFLDESIEFHGRKNESQYMKEFLKPKELPLWRKQSGEFRSQTYVMSVNSLVTSEEWKNCQKISRKLGMEIGDAIIDDIVKEIINLCFQIYGRDTVE